MELIDKAAVVAEIENCYNECLKRAKIVDADYWNAKADAYRNVLTILTTSLEVEEVDFPCDGNRDKELALSLQIQAYLNTASDELYGKGKPLYSKSHLKGTTFEACLKWLEKQTEQKPVDKIEQKFHEGDWITFYGSKPFKILKVESEQNGILDYLLLETSGHDTYYNKKYVDENARLWSIQDAKDGDMLVHNSITFIFKGIEDGIVKGLCSELSDSILNFGESEYDKDYYPATKEQRELLFSKMKEAGYEWDAEKKEFRRNVEPKFKVGDWCIDNEDGVIFQIVKVLDNTYTYKTNEGKEYSCTHYSLENDAHLWTIQDAKDGDVLLSSDGSIFIFKEVFDLGCKHYIALAADGTIQVNDNFAHCWESVIGVCPANKEQRNTLFAKMREADYKWDDENREVKKIEDEEYNGEDYGIDSLFHAQRILEKTLGKVDGYQTDDGILSHKCAITAVKKLYGKKPAWSEEDEHRIKDTIYFLDTAKKHYASTVELDACINWLESHRPQKQWKPSKEQIDALEHFVRSIGESDYASPYDNNTKLLYSLLEQLKKL